MYFKCVVYRCPLNLRLFHAVCVPQLVFHNPITRLGAIGSGVGIGGVLVYSLTKQYYDNRPANLPNTPV
jgi:hypothetical protein